MRIDQVHCTNWKTDSAPQSRDPVPSLPVIDVTGLIDGDPTEFRRAADAMDLAARSFGFFRICNHGISPNLIESTYRMAADFFALPEDIKRQY
jgi:isopenicillin N synthase-like dioxygenase